MPAELALISEIRAALVAAGDPEKAAANQAYMKSELPYYGVSSPDLKRLLRPTLARYEPESRDAHEATVRMLWDEVTHREEWYAAIALARHRCARQWLDPDSMTLWRHLLVTGAWWDVVDEIASHLVWETLAGHRAAVTPVIRAWAADENLWLRRASVIGQLFDEADTDLALALFGGEAGISLDPNYHSPGDDIDVVSRVAVDITSDGMAHLMISLGKSTRPIDTPSGAAIEGADKQHVRAGLPEGAYRR